jgi:transcriptional regulator with XRE-family HTH domain
MNSMDLRRLGSVLREQREAVGIPAAEIARRVGVSPTYIWMVEQARPRKGGEPSRPSEPVLERWTRALGMDARYARQVLLLAGYGEENPESRPTPRLPAPPPARAQIAMPGAPSPEPGPPMMDALFQPVARFEPPPELRADVLTDEVRETLREAEGQGRLEETAGLLEQFLAFLRSRLQ